MSQLIVNDVWLNRAVNNDEFRQFIIEKGRELYRPMPWREDTRPYYVLVSELMLQQTQVPRVVPKFVEFATCFPDETQLAAASLGDVLKLWQGLGYNRRAKYLHDAAKMIVRDYGGVMPTSPHELETLPGVGKNTAGAIMAYAHNRPVLFVETNVRTVYLHHFFPDEMQVSDAAILEKLAATLDHKNPRQFYQALMDYGSHLKAAGVRTNTRSRHYKKQPKLDGSVRQVRGEIIRQLADGSIPQAELAKRYTGDARYQPALDGLKRDGLIELDATTVRLTK